MDAFTSQSGDVKFASNRQDDSHLHPIIVTAPSILSAEKMVGLITTGKTVVAVTLNNTYLDNNYNSDNRHVHSMTSGDDSSEKRVNLPKDRLFLCCI